MKKSTIVLLIALLSAGFLQAQVAITPDGSEADPSAMLDVQSTNKGVLIPRMTTEEIQSISDPANGLIVFCTNDNNLYTYIETESKWKNLYFVQDMCVPFVDLRDTTVYYAVKIGSQCWMAENLNYDQSAYGNDYCYDNETSNCDIYGRLYNWYAMMQGSSSSSANPSGVQGVCPGGWHLPSDDEWTQLTDYLGGEEVAGGKLKETGTTHWLSPNTGATNSSGFTALPGGSYYDSSYDFLGSYGNWWSSTQPSSANAFAWYRGMHSYSGVYRSNTTKTHGFSVRCLRD